VATLTLTQPATVAAGELELARKGASVYEVAEQRHMFHVSPRSNRESILEGGLDPWAGGPLHTDIADYGSEWYPEGVYLFSSLDWAEVYVNQLVSRGFGRCDIWVVDVHAAGEMAFPDPQGNGRDMWYLSGPVESGALALLDG
jgi:hypothetical protein